MKNKYPINYEDVNNQLTHGRIFNYVTLEGLIKK